MVMEPYKEFLQTVVTMDGQNYDQALIAAVKEHVEIVSFSMCMCYMDVDVHVLYRYTYIYTSAIYLTLIHIIIPHTE